MRSRLGLLAAFALVLSPLAARGACSPGIYGQAGGDFVVLGGPGSAGPAGQRYLFLDGRRGVVGGADGLVVCDGDAAVVRAGAGPGLRWPRAATRETPAAFDSDATRLTGELIELAGPPDPRRPLVVLVHGSEKTPGSGSVYAYMLAAQGISVFAYDKRGTGASAGDYTQNFELLADDAAAALAVARRLAAGRFGRSGFLGGSQGGWVAPLAATRSRADFVAVGFGLVVSPIEEDREQMLQEADEMALDARSRALVERLSDATAELVRSHFERGYEHLAQVKRQIGSASWAQRIKGEYSGDILRMDEADLRRIGRARFDNVGLIWDYDAVAVLKRLHAPLLWVLAGEDREAPIGVTRSALAARARAGQPVEVYLFPHTDHGVLEFRTNPDGSRTMTKVADGYLRLLADWIKGEVHPPYGRGERIASGVR